MVSPRLEHAAHGDLANALDGRQPEANPAPAPGGRRAGHPLSPPSSDAVPISSRVAHAAYHYGHGLCTSRRAWIQPGMRVRRGARSPPNKPRGATDNRHPRGLSAPQNMLKYYVP